MSRNYETMTYAINTAKERIVWALKDYVMEVGEEFSDYHRDEFGIEEEEDGAKVLKVLNIFDNGGCYFPWTELHQVESAEGVEAGCCCGWYSYAFHCLYVIEQDGVLHLKYYMLWNNGTEYNSNESEPDHGHVGTLQLQVLDKLIAYIGEYDRWLK